MTQTPIAQLDFDTVKENLKTYLKGQAQFKDYDFAGSNMSVLLDVLAYNTYYNNFYTNMTYAEMFLDSAQLRESVISHAKELNYLPASSRSSQAIVQVELVDMVETPTFVTIPKYARVSGKPATGNKVYTFLTDESYTIIPKDGRYCVNGVRVFEGKKVEEAFRVTGIPSQKFRITNSNVDTASIVMAVRESAEVGAKSEEYVMRTSILGVKSKDKVFYIQPSGEDTYEIHFGQNAFGVMPPANSIVDITYRINNEDKPNGIDRFITQRIGGYKAQVTTIMPSEGGSAPEGIESIRFFAPKSIQIQDRAVTESDYEILLRNEFPEIQAVSVYGGEELNPPQYGRVVVAVDVYNAEGVSANNKAKFRSYLAQRCPITIQPIVVSPEFIHVRVDTKVAYNTKTTEKTEADITQIVENAILQFSDDNLSDFRKTFRFSRLVSAIDNSDKNILSNVTDVRAVIEINPLPKLISSYDIKFRNQLMGDHPLDSSESAINHIPAIRSTAFTYKGTRGYFQDDGKGVLNIIRTQDGKFVYIERDVGTVDYTEGRVIIRNIEIDRYSGPALAITAKLESDDIFTPKERIISIRENDINISVLGVRE
jgi:hypothetical protein